MEANYTELLAWARGPGFEIALAIFTFGIILRLLEILMLGRKKDYFVARESRFGGGFRTMFSRFFVSGKTLQRSWFIIVVGYAFHLGLFVVLFLFTPHIILIQSSLGLNWPGLPSTLVNTVTIVTLLAMLALLFNRLTHKVTRYLSTLQDYFVWLVVFLPLLTGYMAYNHMGLSYQLMLALHILSVELLMVVFPFTKLMHTFTTFTSRWYTGASAAQRGVNI